MTTNITPDTKSLRHFGFILASVFIGLFGLLLPILKQQQTPIWPWILSGVLALVAILLPKGLKLIYTPWMKLGAVLGYINTRIILGFIFFLIITPISLVLRLVKHDPLRRQIEPNATSYRIKSENQPIQHMERPY